ncbi:STAS domain-containing protein [Actinomadura sp. 21ATH]|uniref:STAS domain-containing protein n=1 Tax=Actinomadura sp. 21ATH TaxID=1735444 RepID=UPI0035C01EBF
MLDLAVEVRAPEGVVVVTLAGQVDAVTSPGLRDRLASLIAGGARHLVLDLTAISFIDSTGLQVLTALHRVLEPLDGTITLVGVSPHLREVLRITALTRLFPIYRSVEMAVLAHMADRARDD